MSHTKKSHIHELSYRLQKEVELILGSVDDATLYAEFRDDELTEITGGIHYNLARESLDKRIHHNIKHRAHRQAKTPANIVERIQKFLNLLFKPIQI